MTEDGAPDAAPGRFSRRSLGLRQRILLIFTLGALFLSRNVRQLENTNPDNAAK